MYSTLPSQCSICSTLRGNLTKEVLLQFWDYWKHTIWVWFAQEPLSLRDLCQDGENLQLNWNNIISTRRLDYMLWPWFERVASYGSVYQVNRFLGTAFYVSWQIIRLFTLHWMTNFGVLSSNPKMFFFSQDEPGLIFPLEKVPLLAKWIEAMEKDPAVAQYALPTQVGWIRTI